MGAELSETLHTEDFRCGAIEQAILAASEARSEWMDDYNYALDLYNFKSKRVYGWEAKAPKPWARMFDPVVYEYVSTYRPSIFSATPHRNVSPLVSSQMSEALAMVLESYLSWNITQYRGWQQYIRCATDGLISGQSVAWTRVDRTRRGCVVTERVPPHDILLDPDVECFEDIRWVARRHLAPLWLIKRLYPGTADDIQSNVTPGHNSTFWYDDRSFQKLGLSQGVQHLGVYFEIWSKGGDFSESRHFRGPTPGVDNRSDFCYMIYYPGAKHLLEYKNSWPYEGLQVEGEFPVSLWGHHWSPDALWPMCPSKAAHPFQRFLSWAYSWLMVHMRSAALTKVGLVEEYFKNADKAIQALKSSEDYDVFRIMPGGGGAGGVNSAVQYNQAPPLNPDFFQSIVMASRRVREILGLQDVLRGTTDSQFRSAGSAYIANKNARLPIEDMAAGFIEFLSEIGRKEAILTLSHVPSKTITTKSSKLFGMDRFGTIAQAVWDLRPTDPEIIASETSVGVVAGTTARKDRDREIYEADKAVQALTSMTSAVGQYAEPQQLLAQWNVAINKLLTAMDMLPSNIPQLSVSPQVLAQAQVLQQQMAASQTQLAMAQQAASQAEQPSEADAMINGEPVYGSPE